MRSITIFFFFFLLFGLENSYSQKTDTAAVNKKHFSLKPSFDFDQRFSFIRTRIVNIWGERVGIIINDEFKTGVGGYFLSDLHKGTSLGVDGNPLYYAKRNLAFGTAYFEPFLFRRDLWEFSIPFELGYGKSHFNIYQWATDNFVESHTADFFPSGVGLSLSLKAPEIRHLKPLRWVGINGLIGYRVCLLENVFKTDYDGPFWSISGTIFLDRAVDDIKEWKQKRRAQKR